MTGPRESYPTRTRGVREAKFMKRECDFSKGKCGAVAPPEPGKTRITILLCLRHPGETPGRWHIAG